MSLTACSGSAVESTTIALSPPVSAIKRRVGREVFGHRAVDEPGGLGRAGEADAVDAGVGAERCPNRGTIAGQ